MSLLDFDSDNVPSKSSLDAGNDNTSSDHDNNVLLPTPSFSTSVLTPTPVEAKVSSAKSISDTHPEDSSKSDSPPEPSLTVTDLSASAKNATDDGIQELLSQFDPLSLNKQKKQPSETSKEMSSDDLDSPSKSNPPPPSSSRPITPEPNEKTGLQSHHPEPNLPPPFDFQWFLDLLRHKSADPIARYLKSFLNEFNKRNWTSDEQIKIITDFKTFIVEKMQVCPPFSTLSDPEMDNAMEGMEKLIMNRLYTKTFSPEIPEARRADSHEEDAIRDRVLDDKMTIWHWIEGRHLDIPNRFLRNGEAFVKLASDELRKINHYRAPRDKVVCILNCCKVIFGLLRQTSREENADSFLPILIYVVIKAHPTNLISNINYIQRFRNPDKLFGEAGYYLSSLQGAVSFVETLDLQSLSITEEEFNRKVDESVVMNHPEQSPQPPVTPDRSRTPDPSYKGPATVDSPRGQGNLTPSTVLQNSAGLLAVPFKSFAGFFQSEPASPLSKSETNLDTWSGDDDAIVAKASAHPELAQPTPYPYGASLDSKSDSNLNDNKSKLSPEELAARQISAEEEEARRITKKEFDSVVDALSQMFPGLDRNVIIDVATEKQGRVGAAVDACLSLLS